MEIERKFLVVNDNWTNYPLDSVSELQQIYLSIDPCVRIRVDNTKKKSWICCKKKTDNPMIRTELEYEINYLKSCMLLNEFNGKNLISKKRYTISIHNHKWEIDEFHGRHQGLVIAEVELESKDEQLIIPDFCGLEKTNDPKFLNVHLFQTKN